MLKYSLGLLFLFITCLCNAGQALAEDAVMFETSSLSVNNRSPFIMLFGVVTPTLSTDLAVNKTRSTTQLDVANYLSKHESDNALFFIDGESKILTQTFTSSWDTSHWGSIQWSVSIPWLKHSAGKLDRSIYEFHDILSLPQNGRTDKAHDRFFWFAKTGDKTVYNNTDRTSGLGDASISLTQRYDEWQLSASIKLPTGKFEKQTGSEGVDLGLSATQFNPSWLRDRSWLKNVPLSVWWGAGLSYLSEAKALSAFEQNNLVIALNSGLAWQIAQRWQLKTQLDTHSPLFDSEIRELGWVPLLFSFAGQYNISHDTSMTLSINEDLRPRVTPDVIFGLALQTDF